MSLSETRGRLHLTTARVLLQRVTTHVVVLLTAALPSQVLAQGVCQIHIVDYNLDRYVYGSVSAECPGNWPHDPPFGNWGVDSIHGSRYDGFQFRGWKQADGWLQWNSCTTHIDFSPPSCQYYNWQSCTTQIDTPVREFAQYWSDLLPWSCSDYGTIYTMNGYFMNIYELDPGSSDTQVAVASYPSFNITLSGGNGYYSGTSSDIDPSSVTGTWGANLTAKLRVFIEMWGS